MKYTNELLTDMAAFAKKDAGMNDLLDTAYEYFVLCGSPSARSQIEQENAEYMASLRSRIWTENTRYGL